MAEEESLEYTPTWIVALVCFVFVLLSLAAERGLHLLGKCLKRKGQESLYEALQKIKGELMLLGFISLLLTVFQGFVSDICIPKHLTNYMLPCKKENADHEGNSHSKYAYQPSWSKRRLLAEASSHCELKGKAQLVSLEGLHQLHIFIFVLAIVYVISCAAIMILGGFKVRKWKHWEDSLRREIEKAQKAEKEAIAKGEESDRVNHIYTQHRREFFKTRRGYSTVLGVTMSFFKQFYGSVKKSDYINMRHGFIMTHCPTNLKYNFHKYMLRTLEYDFKKVVGISWYLWVFVVLFLLLNLKGWHAYFWLSFLPLILLLIVGTKLEHIIVCLADEIEEKDKKNIPVQNQTQGTDEKEFWVQPSDKHFWFGSPSLFLYMIHFILFQNSFEIAFFLWVLFTYGVHSCILDKVGFIIPRLIVGVIVQVLCSYSTLPLYTIVSQMGSMFKHGIFDKEVHNILKNWVEDGKDAVGGSHSSHRIEMQNLAPESWEIISGAEETTTCVENFTAP
ncbi:MLO-like protein 13 [Chenopodium quinoa]|uniref:MLO-like protein 13 n=1 Tax=Chenopodium quinoa TaxID=63459 RepID=UPI000B793A7C|nr:MLO-like protein 13 [Chenopodium quinoa]